MIRPRDVFSVDPPLGERWGPVPMAVVAVCIALGVAFLPRGVEKVLARRSATPIRIAASTGTPADSAAGAGGRVCRGPDDRSERFLSDTRLIAVSTDSAWNALRVELEIPPVVSSAVGLVSDEVICRRVRDAIDAARTGDEPSPAPESLYVARAGRVFIAMAPSPQDSTLLVHTVLSDRYTVLSKYAK
jgi:hypothetical protein